MTALRQKRPVNAQTRALALHQCRIALFNSRNFFVCIQIIIRLDPGVKNRAKCHRREDADRKGKPMAHDEPQVAGLTKLVIRNIGLLLSGAMEKPILDADTIVAENGKITGIGRAKDIDAEGATTIIDANGTTVAPGLIDSHVHPVAGDWTPRQNQIGWE